MKRALVIGYGSIGQRHARLLAGLGLDVRVATSQPDVPGAVGRSVAGALDLTMPDLVVIANPTACHATTLHTLAHCGFSGVVAVEKPLFHQPLPLAPFPFERCVVTYQLRFSPVLRALREAVGADRILAVQIRCGQYLPTWRPERDYRQTYSAFGSLGGGVLRDLSHELDWALWMFGPWRRVTALGGKRGPLETQSDDCWQILLETTSGILVSFQLDYYHRPGGRSVTTVGECHTLTADIGEGSLLIDGREHQFPADRDIAYREQWRAITGRRLEDVCDVTQGMAVVELIAAIEKAAGEKRWLTR